MALKALVARKVAALKQVLADTIDAHVQEPDRQATHSPIAQSRSTHIGASRRVPDPNAERQDAEGLDRMQQRQLADKHDRAHVTLRLPP